MEDTSSEVADADGRREEEVCDAADIEKEVEQGVRCVFKNNKNSDGNKKTMRNQIFI
jgi:hypothetical protein